MNVKKNRVNTRPTLKKSEKKQHPLRGICQEMLWGIGIAVAMFVLLTVSYTLPDENIRSNIKDGSETLSLEGLYPAYYSYDMSGILDNYTDSLILNIAYNNNEGKSVLEKALTNAFYDEGASNPVKSLEKYTAHDLKPNFEYTRYWFGTSGLVRYLMSFMSFLDVRFLFMTGVMISAGAAVFFLSRTAGAKYACVFALALYLTQICSVSICFQYAPAMTIANLGVLAVCIAERKKVFRKAIPYIFITIGVVTVFFDLLTFPLLTFGMPMVTALLVFLKKQDSDENYAKAENSFVFLIKCGAFWSFSYIGMNLFKWILASVILRENEFATVKEKFLTHTDAVGRFTLAETLIKNCSCYFSPVILALILLFTAGWIIRELLVQKRGISELFTLQRSAFLLVMISPFIWYCLLKSHSNVHYWMTYRSLAVTLYAYLSWLIFDADSREPLQ